MTFPKPPFWIVTAYFLVLISLSAMSFVPGLVLYGMLLGFVPGLLILASNTVLLYSLLLVPLGLALWARPLIWPLRMLLALVSIALVPAVAFGVPYLSNRQYDRAVSSLTSGDRVETPPTAPRGIAIGTLRGPSWSDINRSSAAGFASVSSTPDRRTG